MLHRTLLIPALLIAAAVAFACGGDDDQEYPVDLDDDAYDLSAMQLTEADLPEDEMAMFLSDSYTNEEWAGVATSQDESIDAEQRRIQFEAQGRVLGYLTLFTWESPIQHLGKTQSFESHSILYKDTQSASDAMTLRACGLLVPDDKPLDSFEVPRLADESAGFSHSEELALAPQVSLGQSVETVVCTRTGRVVHAIVQTGLDGTQDNALVIDLARRQLEYVDAAFNGEDPPAPDES